MEQVKMNKRKLETKSLMGKEPTVLRQDQDRGKKQLKQSIPHFSRVNGFLKTEVSKAAQPERKARMEMTTSVEMKKLFTRAAALTGMDVNAFVLGPAIERAQKVLSDYAQIELSQKNQLALVSLLNTQHTPTKAMQDLMALPAFVNRKV